MVSGLVVTPVSPALGAEVEGLDLRRPLDGGQAEALRSLLAQHLVLFFRDQELTDDQHLAFAATFGVPNVYPVTRARGLDLPLEWLVDTADSPPKADLWHTDAAFLPEPPDVAVLAMQETPPTGGDTLWANLYALHDALSPTLQAAVAPLWLDLHPGEFFRDKVVQQFGDEVFDRVAGEFAGAQHPLVRVHPVTGRRALFLCGAYVRGIAGLHPDESDALLALVRRGLDDPNHQVRWRYRPHDVVVWDERCTNHRAVGDHYPARRVVRRCTVGASVPVGPVPAAALSA